MSSTFGQVLSALRRERGMSQRTAAAELHISQALLLSLIHISEPTRH